MKRFTTGLGAALMLLFATLLAAPAAVYAQDENPTGFTLRFGEGRDAGKLQLRVGPTELTLGKGTADYKKRRPSATLNGISDLELGFNVLTGIDYTGYAPEEQQFLDFRTASMHYSMQLIGVDFFLNRNQTWNLGFGLSYTVDNYRFASASASAAYEGGRLIPAASPDGTRKSKLRATYLGIPVSLTTYPGKSFVLGFTLYNDFLMGGNAITKRPKRKQSIRAFDNYQLGAGVSLGYDHFGVYGRYGFRPLFKAGPDTHVVSAGVWLGF